MSAAAFRHAMSDEDDFECSGCGRRFRRNTAPITVYRMAAEVASRPRPEAGTDDGITRAKYVFRRHGKGWEVVFRGKPALMRHSRGLFYISRLLAEPGRDVPAVSLLAAATGIDPRVPAGSSGLILTDQARTEYESRFNELQEELQEAKANNDMGRIERAQTEMEALGTEIARATGLSGRKRELTDAEKVRKAVSNAVTRAIDSFDEKKYRELVQHLRASISSGRFFKYDPEQSIDWLL
jgi:methylmalonyl-CoA mutase cobalamin-binding subunit